MSVENNEVQMTEISVNDFYVKLSERVSGTNAKLLLSSAIVGSSYAPVDGVEGTSPMNVDDVKSLCLELIKKGGPSFQVGKNMYHQI